MTCSCFPCWECRSRGILRKFYVFKAAINSKLIWLAVLMTINTAIGAYYYLRVIVVMYMRETRADVLRKLPPASADGGNGGGSGGAGDALSGAFAKSCAWNCAFAKPYPVGALVDRFAL